MRVASFLFILACANAKELCDIVAAELPSRCSCSNRPLGGVVNCSMALLGNDHIGMMIELLPCDESAHIDVVLTESAHGLNFTLKSITAKYEKKIPVPGLQFDIPKVGGKVGADLSVLIGGGAEDFYLKVGLDACGTIENHTVCGEQLTSHLPFWVLHGKYNFGKFCNATRVAKDLAVPMAAPMLPNKTKCALKCAAEAVGVWGVCAATCVTNPDNAKCIEERCEAAQLAFEVACTRQCGKSRDGMSPPSGSAAINEPSYIDALNKVESTWTAGSNSVFDNRSFDQARVLLGTELLHIDDHLGAVLDDAVYGSLGEADVPTDFDARTKWPGLVHPIRNQEQCGSCWAFSASEVFSDRVAIATGKPSPVLSAEDMVSCDGGDMGCGGGRLPTAWDYITKTGLVSDSCFPYAAGNGTAPSCPNKCSDGESWEASKVKAKSAYAINGVLNMQKEIMTNGPIQVAYMVYKSFMSYKSGVYQRHWYEILPEGGHAVKIVGWGIESGTDYWLVANSWGADWGLDGYFKIKRGTNACGMEKMGPPYAGLPAVTAQVIV